MTKSELDKQLKNDAELNKFSIEADYLIFDNSANLSYPLCTGLTLGNLLTKNPISNTRLSKNLLLILVNTLGQIKFPVSVLASYRSHEYDLLTFGLSDSPLYKTGNAVLLGCDALEVANLANFCKEAGASELFKYPFGVHVGYSKTENLKDFTLVEPTFMDTIKKLVLIDKMKNVLIAAVVAGAGWFFFIRKK